MNQDRRIKNAGMGLYTHTLAVLQHTGQIDQTARKMLTDALYNAMNETSERYHDKREQDADEDLNREEHYEKPEEGSPVRWYG